MDIEKKDKVSRVSEVTKMSKQGKQQSLHSLRPMGEGGRRPDEGLKETGRLACTTTQKITERNVSLNDALASGSAMVSENISFCSQSAWFRKTFLSARNPQFSMTGLVTKPQSQPHVNP